MRIIIAGSRAIGRISQRRWNYEQLAELVEQAVAQSGLSITDVISGSAGGPDRAGEQWAAKHNIPITVFKPNWKLGRGAGLIRNREMVEHAEALIALFDGQSPGTQDTIDKMLRKGRQVFLLTVSVS